eukprot:19477-Heterococcus_DN1.PRE.1
MTTHVHLLLGAAAARRHCCSHGVKRLYIPKVSTCRDLDRVSNLIASVFPIRQWALPPPTHPISLLAVCSRGT